MKDEIKSLSGARAPELRLCLLVRRQRGWSQRHTSSHVLYKNGRISTSMNTLRGKAWNVTSLKYTRTTMSNSGERLLRPGFGLPINYYEGRGELLRQGGPHAVYDYGWMSKCVLVRERRLCEAIDRLTVSSKRFRSTGLWANTVRISQIGGAKCLIKKSLRNGGQKWSTLVPTGIASHTRCLTL